MGTTVMKNCEPLVPGPALAMLRVYGRSCLSVAWNSSSNSPPQILSPPMPVPVGSPVWIMKPCMQHGEGVGGHNHRAADYCPTSGEILTLDGRMYLDDSVEYVAVVVAVPAVNTEILHSFGASVKQTTRLIGLILRA